MGLIERDEIDIVAQSPKGEVVLVIRDTGVGYDERDRLRLLKQKIRTCLKYVYDEQFPLKHPGKTVSDVRILVSCNMPPTQEMEELGGVSKLGARERIPVDYEYLPPT